MKHVALYISFVIYKIFVISFTLLTTLFNSLGIENGQLKTAQTFYKLRYCLLMSVNTHIVNACTQLYYLKKYPKMSSFRENSN